MTDADKAKVKTMVASNEGYRQFPYADTRGIATVGYGRNLAHVGIARHEADALLENDLTRAGDYLAHYPWFAKLNAPRQSALIDMVFNLGAAKFEEFTTLITLLARGDYAAAANDMRRTLWAQQVGARASRDAIMIERGVWLG